MARRAGGPPPLPASISTHDSTTASPGATRSDITNATGHDNVVPNGVLTPGNYEARFSATAYDSTTNESVGFVVVALPPGHTKPVPKITSPTDGAEYTTSSGPVSVDLVGSATDAEDGSLPGTMFRWVARADGHEVVLCTGSAFHPPAELGKVAIHKDCSDVTAELDVSPLAPGDWTWQLFLEVRDYASDIDNAAASIEVILNVG